MRDRRSQKNYKLRVYMDELKAANQTTSAGWNDQWAANATKDSPYMNRESWISYLEKCILTEVNSMLKKEAA